jgi:hypothetical protein
VPTTKITIVAINVYPSVMAKVPHKLAIIESLTHSLVFGGFPTFCFWKILVGKSLKGIVHHHH